VLANDRVAAGRCILRVVTKDRAMGYPYVYDHERGDMSSGSVVSAVRASHQHGRVRHQVGNGQGRLFGTRHTSRRLVCRDPSTSTKRSNELR
jgi:hypothetical protein